MATSPATVEPLEPLLPILNAFIHRHKNQHSSSHWFRYVPILRRSLRSLLATSLSSKTTPALLSSKATAAQDARLKRHARWLQSKVIPRCFLTFSQLAADNQHAPIGLLLIALLARVNTVLEAILPPPPVVSQPPTSTTTTSTTKPTQPPTTSSDTLDRGTVIARPLPSSTKKPKATSTLPIPESTAKANTLRPSTAGDESKPKKVDKKLEKRAILSVEEEDEAPPRRDKVTDKKSSKLKTKKKKKAGDAFSDMFGGL